MHVVLKSNYFSELMLRKTKYGPASFATIYHDFFSCYL